MPRVKRFWLFKSDPEAFSIKDLAACPKKTDCWDGVRNYQARNMLRDDVGRGDGVLFYHSSCKVPAVVGIARVVKGGYPDPTQFDPQSEHPDPKSDPQDPRWFAVDIRLERIFKEPLSLQHMRGMPALKEMLLLRRGMRLSVQPATEQEWRAILQTVS